MEGAGGQTGGWDERGGGQKEKKNLEAPPWKSESCSCAAGRIATSSVLKAHKQKQPFPKACMCVSVSVCVAAPVSRSGVGWRWGGLSLLADVSGGNCDCDKRAISKSFCLGLPASPEFTLAHNDPHYFM